MTQPRKIGDISFWYADIGLPKTRRKALAGDTAVDVAIIGAGYTGLWSAYYLKKADPSLNILVIEKEFAGFGASGRNGGWLSGGVAWNHARYAADKGEGPVRQMVQAMNGTVAEVIRVATEEGIEADILPTDELMVATNPAQLERMKAEVAHRRHWGEESRTFEIGAEEARARVNVPGILGGMIVTDVARVQPAKLLRGLAEVVERLGVQIVEGTTVTGFSPGVVQTDCGTVKARFILRATEGFTANLPGHEREWLPLNSAQIATEPLPPHVWDEIGWQKHEIFGDFNNAYCYCQRTREGRITVGARTSSLTDVQRVFGNPAYPFPDDPRFRNRPCVVRCHRRAARLVHDRGAGPGDRHRLGRGLCGGGGLHLQPLGPHAGRSGPEPRYRVGAPALGQPQGAGLGAGALPLAGGSQHVFPLAHRRPARGAAGHPALALCQVRQLADRAVLRRIGCRAVRSGAGHLLRQAMKVQAARSGLKIPASAYRTRTEAARVSIHSSRRPRAGARTTGST